MNNKIILATTYFPTIQYMSKFLADKNIIIEKHENYIKQSYKNRCNILAANGVQALTIPVKKVSGKKTIITKILIDYDINWQSLHLKTIDSAYKSSPFYEFYIDAFIPFFKKKYKYLFDFNIEILKVLLKEIEVDKAFDFSNEYLPTYKNDYRMSINPKKKYQIEDKTLILKEYSQVFSSKFGFTKDLSILDLLFNEGPNTRMFLNSMIR